MGNSPKNEQITGANLTGSSGAVNRTYVLANDDAIAAMMQVARDGAFVQQGLGFTFSTTTNAITFLTAVWDEQIITLDYFVDETVTLSGSLYCTTLQIAQYSGVGVEVFLETLGTGDGSAVSYDAENGSIIAGSYAVKHGVLGSNALSTLIETTHYTLDKDSGGLLLTSAGATAVDDDVLYMSYTYSSNQSDTILNTYLEPASREVDKLTQNYWGEDKTSNQFFDGYDSGYPQTDEPFGIQINPYPEFELKFKGITSITSITLLDRQGSVDDTLDSDEYRIITDDDTHESRVLVDRTIPNGKANVKIVFLHGYDSVPALVQELTALLGSVMTYVNITGGSYDAITSYTLGRKNFVQGEQYVNIREVLAQINARIDTILTQLGGNFSCA